MKWSWVLFSMLVAMCLVIGVTVTIDELPHSHGMPHPTFETMQHGGSGVSRHQPVLWLAGAFGVLQISFFVACLLLGLKDARKHKWSFLLSGLLYVGVFTLMVVADQRYIRADSPPLWFSFPAPTAVMLYAVWTVPVVFMALYVVHFDRWVLTKEDLERFRSIHDAKRPPGERDL